jgi:hypothetical protein
MIPHVTPEQMEQIVRRHLPGAAVNVQSINPEYRSWRMGVCTPRGELEFSWGPLTGFGVADFRLDNENPFAPYDYRFESLEEAETFLTKYLNEPG